MDRPHTHLFFTDPHATPDHNHDRFTAIGRLAVDIKPDILVCGGDFAENGASFVPGKGKRSHEGKRIKADIQAAIEAQEALFKPILLHNMAAVLAGRPTYTPRLVMCLGNHDTRLDKIGENMPEFDGMLSSDLLRYKENGWEVHPENVPVVIDGVAYAHTFADPQNGKPISGAHVATKLLKAKHQSCTGGHLHVFDYATEIYANGKRMHGLVPGCALDVDQSLGYENVGGLDWWRGVVIKHDVYDGEYDLEKISMARLRRTYL